MHHRSQFSMVLRFPVSNTIEIAIFEITAHDVWIQFYTPENKYYTTFNKLDILWLTPDWCITSTPCIAEIGLKKFRQTSVNASAVFAGRNVRGLFGFEKSATTFAIHIARRNANARPNYRLETRKKKKIQKVNRKWIKTKPNIHEKYHSHMHTAGLKKSTKTLFTSTDAGGEQVTRCLEKRYTKW